MIPAHPDVFVIGDAASAKQRNGKPIPGVAPAAIQAGSYVAKIIADSVLKGQQPENRPVFKYRDKGQMAIIGRGHAITQIGRWKCNGWFAWMIWLFIHVLFLVDFRSKIAVMLNWFWAYLGNKQGSRVFTSSAGTPNRESQ